MEDFVRRGSRNEHQWYPTTLSSSRGPSTDKGDDGVNGLGTGALHFIRNRGSVRRHLKREASNRNKTSNEGHVATLSTDAGGSNGGGGFGKWLRDHLGGGSRNNQEIVASISTKKRPSNASYDLTLAENDKNLIRTTHTPQNLYCSLPREQHRRQTRVTSSKSSHEMARERARSYGGAVDAVDGANHRERSIIKDFAGITRGGPIYGSEGKSSRRREREKRRHSMNETKIHSRHQRIGQSMELKIRSGESMVRADEDDDLDLLLLLEPEENQRNIRSTKLSNGDSPDLAHKERIIEETSKVIGNVKITDDSSGSYEELSDIIEKSEVDEVAEKIEEIESGEEDREDNAAGVGDEFFKDNEDEDEREEEEEVCSAESGSGGREKLDDDAEVTASTRSEEVDIDALDDIPLEIFRDRHALIRKLYELKNDEPDLKRKNRLLQYWVARVMNKKQQTMTPEDETLSERGTSDFYVKKLIYYKTTIEEIEARDAEIRNELDLMEENLQIVLDEDSLTFGRLLAREREIGVGLVFEKSGRVISVRAIEAMIRRKVLRRDLLNRDRFEYIFHRHRHEDAKRKLHLAENLGEGMTIMDYEMMRSENEGYKEKLEERDKILEKLSVKVENIINTLAHYKEKRFANLADIWREKKRLDIVKSENLRTREGLTEMHKLLWKIRDNCAYKKRQAGLLFAIPVVREMEKTLKIVNELRIEIERMMPKDWSDDGAGTARKNLKVDENRTTVKRVTRVKSEGPRKMRPGRC